MREYRALSSLLVDPEQDATARRELSSARTIVHDDLIRLLGPDYDRPFNMLTFARSNTEPNPSMACESCGRDTHVRMNGLCIDCAYAEH